jgi:hypothetical protein
MHPPQVGSANGRTARKVAVHTKVNHPEDFASYVHTIKDVPPGY